jgi:hypothetical protein
VGACTHRAAPRPGSPRPMTPTATSQLSRLAPRSSMLVSQRQLVVRRGAATAAAAYMQRVSVAACAPTCLLMGCDMHTHTHTHAPALCCCVLLHPALPVDDAPHHPRGHARRHQRVNLRACGWGGGEGGGQGGAICLQHQQQQCPPNPAGFTQSPHRALPTPRRPAANHTRTMRATGRCSGTTPGCSSSASTPAPSDMTQRRFGHCTQTIVQCGKLSAVRPRVRCWCRLRHTY